MTAAFVRCLDPYLWEPFIHLFAPGLCYSTLQSEEDTPADVLLSGALRNVVWREDVEVAGKAELAFSSPLCRCSP